MRVQGGKGEGERGEPPIHPVKNTTSIITMARWRQYHDRRAPARRPPLLRLAVAVMVMLGTAAMAFVTPPALRLRRPLPVRVCACMWVWVFVCCDMRHE